MGSAEVSGVVVAASDRTSTTGSLPDSLSLSVPWRVPSTFEPLFEGRITSSVSLAMFAHFIADSFLVIKQGVALSL